MEIFFHVFDLNAILPSGSLICLYPPRSNLVKLRREEQILTMANRRMFRKFERILKEARLPERRITLNESRTRIVLFSDHHKGDGSPADDFKKNAALYSAALDHYAGKGFKLLVIGDNEELWESEYGPILTEHQTLIEKEIHLALENLEGKKIRIWGNHDKEVTLRTFRR